MTSVNHNADAVTNLPARGRMNNVADVKRHIDTSPERVWAELSDAWMYTGWVVGASHIRGVDGNWPQVGSRLQHQVGAWPVVVSDETVVLESEAPRRLVLQAKAWPGGEARVELTLRPDGDGTEVTMSEVPTRGPAAVLHNPVQDRVLYHRNVESLARLASIAEKRPMPGFPPPAKGTSSD